MNKKILVFVMLLLVTGNIYAQQIIKGRLITNNGQPIAGVTIEIGEAKTLTTSDANGHFILKLANGKYTLQFRHTSYTKTQAQIIVPYKGELLVKMQSSDIQLETVNVVSTGYQSIPKHQLTGSATQVDHQLLNRKVSTNLLDRLEDVSSGLSFNRGSDGKTTGISIRGQSSLSANSKPLVILDNFPYEGDLSSINPNDVESITILKDAAAASIWGAKAGNGVIVITSIKGKYNSAPTVNASANITVTDKPDLYYRPQMTSAGFIETERTLFKNGFYTQAENSVNKTALNPAVELLIANRDKKLSDAELETGLNRLKQYDLRDDLDKYVYRSGLKQQYALNVSGGTTVQQYYISAGYDRNLSQTKGSKDDRITLKGTNTYRFLNDKLEFGTGLTFSYGTQLNTEQPILKNLYPYARLADDQGNPLVIYKDFREGYINASSQQDLLNWQYKPLKEIDLTNDRVQSTQYLLNASLKYHISPELTANILYQYGNIANHGTNLHPQESYFTSNLINRFTTRNPDGSLKRAIPLGAIQDLSSTKLINQNVRAQLDYNKYWNGKNQLNLIGGWELIDNQTKGLANRVYGFDQEHNISFPIDPIGFYPQYYNNGITSKIPYTYNQTAFIDRFISWYFNGSYTYKSKYILSASTRNDRSNLFGVATNKKGVPLYSIGAKWHLSKEPFFSKTKLPELSLRASFGSNGNVDKSISALTTASYFTSAAFTQLPYATIVNPPNDQLRWERVKIWNTGLDFNALNSRINGSFDFYFKNGIDLIGNTPFAPSTGIVNFKGNTAKISGKGFDLVLNSLNFNQGFKWETNLLLSLAKEKVSDYKTKTTGGYYVQFGNSGKYPLEGRPLYSLFSYQWAGLDAITGAPMGYLKGEKSTDYNVLVNSLSAQDIIYNGSSRPTTFGSIRNTFSYKRVSLSVNISFRLGYYFRKESISYAPIFNGSTGHGDFAKRWQKPGDERFTQVPSMPSRTDDNRDTFYTYSDLLVYKGDHVRLQDINLSYSLPPNKSILFKQVRLFLYANNIGLLWKANKMNVDPDFQFGRPSQTLSLGLNAGF